MQGLALQPQIPPNSAPQGMGESNPSVITVADIRKLLFKRKWLILSGVVIGVAAGIFEAKTTIPEYDAVARVDIDLSRSSDLGLSEALDQTIGVSSTQDELQTQLHIMQSDSVAINVIRTLELYRKPAFVGVFGKAGYTGKVTPAQQLALVKQFKGATQVLLLPNTDIAEVHFTDPDPGVAQAAANQIVRAYQAWTLQSHFDSMTQASEWLSQQMVTLQTKVTNSQNQLVDYQREHNLLSSGPEGQSLVDSDLQTVNGQLAEAKADRIVKEARYRMALTRNPDLLVSVAAGTVLASLRQQEATLLVQKANLQSKFGPAYPSLREIQKQIAAVDSDIDREITALTQRFNVEYEAAAKTENLLQARLDETKQAAFRQNASTAQFEILKHNAEASSELYDALQLRLQEAGITAGLNSNNVVVVDQAMLPVVPVLPRKLRDVEFGFAGGLVIGLALAVLLESLDDTLRTSEDAEAVLLLPALAVVPRFQPLNKRAMIRRAEDKAEASAGPDLPLSRDLITFSEPQSLVAENFRTLRSSILLSSVDREPKVMMLTSGLAAEGKSTCSANLAISLAQKPARVLLVDTDLRKGTLHLKFRVSNRTGLSTYLARESGEEAFTTPLAELPNLYVLPRGPIAPSPGEMLASRMMGETLRRWREEWDYVILDTSPVLAVADSLSLVQHVDGVLLVVRSGVTRKRALVRSRELLRRANGRMLGSIVNGVDMRLENYYTYSRGYSYGYRNGYESAYGSGYGVKDADNEL
jgi:polysaccharide biosynthesis transport protein